MMVDFADEDGVRIILQNPSQSPVYDIATAGSPIPAESNAFIAVKTTIVRIILYTQGIGVPLHLNKLFRPETCPKASI